MYLCKIGGKQEGFGWRGGQRTPPVLHGAHLTIPQVVAVHTYQLLSCCSFPVVQHHVVEAMIKESRMENYLLHNERHPSLSIWKGDVRAFPPYNDYVQKNKSRRAPKKVWKELQRFMGIRLMGNATAIPALSSTPSNMLR